MHRNYIIQCSKHLRAHGWKKSRHKQRQGLYTIVRVTYTSPRGETAHNLFDAMQIEGKHRRDNSRKRYHSGVVALATPRQPVPLSEPYRPRRNEAVVHTEIAHFLNERITREQFNEEQTEIAQKLIEKHEGRAQTCILIAIKIDAQQGKTNLHKKPK